MASDSLRYVPLGGLGEVGRNMWTLEYQGRLLVVDAGLMFPSEEMHGVDLVIPDYSFLFEAGRDVAGIVVTHGHEDHIGAVPFLVKRFLAEGRPLPPIFGTRLTLGLVRPKLKEHRVLREADLREVRLGDRVQLGPFRVEFIAVCHSIPDSAALAVATPVGTVVYTSDFKLDAHPLDGQPTDLDRFRALGDEGVLLLLADSTNAEREGRSGSERDLVEPFERIFREAPGRIVVATFASNLNRIQQLLRLAQEFDRRVAVVGRSLQQNVRTAQELGVLQVPQGVMVPLAEVDKVPDGRLLLLTAGSQGEPMSALARFANGTHPAVGVRAGDRVLISATPIPGNERLVHRTINNLYKNGAEVYYSSTGRVHVSGHGSREELAAMIDAVRPQFFIPVHGEYRQLVHHARLAEAAATPPERIAVVENGDEVEFGPAGLEVREAAVPAGYVYVDGMGIGDVEEIVLRDRRKLAGDGMVIVTLAVDHDTGELRAGPELISRGFIEEEVGSDVLEEARRRILADFDRRGLGEPGIAMVKETVHDAVAGVLHKRTRRRPMIIPVVTQL